MKLPQLVTALSLTLSGLPQVVGAQDVRLRTDDTGRQCAILGTDLHAYLQTAMPDCSEYCLVERNAAEVTPENINTMIFECVDEDRAAALPMGDGLRAAAALGILGIILSLDNGPSGSTSDTQ